MPGWRMSHSWSPCSAIPTERRAESFADDLNKRRSIVSGRVTLLPRSTEIQLLVAQIRPILRPITKPSPAASCDARGSFRGEAGLLVVSEGRCGFRFSVVVRLPPPPSCGCPRAVVRRFRPKRGSKIRPERNRAPWSPVAPGALLPYQGLAGPIPEGQGLSSPLPERESPTRVSPGFRASAFRERIALGRPFPDTRDLVGEHVPVETLVSRDQPRRGTRYGPPCCVSHPGFYRVL
ncbi:hypothetical protein QJS10_CPA08g00781 [Acorus calamus]|uniref:Uncharacterized protein n=1 Tax=Acorus calamus TaxID=4465 RepID=A0AAV9EAS5_ACOCL|nr:hypothetical protein QJS10_CPA08g00781 [Acorus calamus]